MNASHATTTVHGGPCPFCTKPLPEGRAVTFCPHCGQNVTVRHCPACSSEVESGWRHCVTCGREVGAPAR
jgi:predicted amidophosphoribosyltransferase